MARERERERGGDQITWLTSAAMSPSHGVAVCVCVCVVWLSLPNLSILLRHLFLRSITINVNVIRAIYHSPSPKITLVKSQKDLIAIQTPIKH